MDDTPIEALVERLNRVYADELGDCEFMVDKWNSPDTCWRLRITPKKLEDGSWVTDVGPILKSKNELRLFMWGVEFNGNDVERKSKLD